MRLDHRKKGLERTCKPGSVPPSAHRRAVGVTTISLGRRLPGVSSSRPGSGWRNGPFRADLRRAEATAISNFFLLGLAPDGVYRARPVTRPAGELLPHRFTLTCGANSPGGLFSVALSLASRPVGVTHHRTLRSPDFPPASVPRGCQNDSLWPLASDHPVRSSPIPILRRRCRLCGSAAQNIRPTDFLDVRTASDLISY